ncbi:MAG: ferritin [Candidatus Melainabacteria bacterium HGW-Melainabacteria-1]|nr:MAG: ferritin [Candidatus Melainabacteria bacterium HGW-Melainabacteria-1]
MTEYHEPYEQLDDDTRNYHRAIKSLMEELEAVDWYQQRVVSCSDPELKKILAHNRDEEIEHACMALEWLRRNMPGWEKNLRTFLFQDPSISITEIEEKTQEA